PWKTRVRARSRGSGSDPNAWTCSGLSRIPRPSTAAAASVSPGVRSRISIMGSRPPEGDLPDEIAIRLSRRQVHVSLEAPADRGDGLAGDRIERLFLIILPIDPDTPRLPAGQAVEVEAALSTQELALRLHRKPRQCP